MANSKGIGNNFEREWSKLISIWMTENEDELIIWRNISSGSIGTIRANKGQSKSGLGGDFICINPEYQDFVNLFYMDSKCYKEVNLLFTNKKNQKSNDIFNQWIKTVDQCPSNAIPMMPCKIRDRKTPNFILFPDSIKFCFGSNYIKYYFEDDRLKRYNFILVLQDEFFKRNRWKEFVDLNSKK